MDCRLIIDGPADGAWNMAVDEALLISASGAGQGGATLRFYQWEQPTLSLGYFQQQAGRDAHAASRDCPVVRRSTGGGAILHDRELTYSLTLPVESHLGIGLRDFYFAFHETLVEALKSFGIGAALCTAPVKLRADDEPFLCFQRRAEGDVLLEEMKICGSAQRRYRGALLQHGSLLLAASPAAPEVSGVCDLTRQTLETEQIQNKWTPLIKERLSINFNYAQLMDRELSSASELVTTKFCNDAWTSRR